MSGNLLPEAQVLRMLKDIGIDKKKLQQMVEQGILTREKRGPIPFYHKEQVISLLKQELPVKANQTQPSKETRVETKAEVLPRGEHLGLGLPPELSDE